MNSNITEAGTTSVRYGSGMCASRASSTLASSADILNFKFNIPYIPNCVRTRKIFLTLAMVWSVVTLSKFPIKKNLTKSNKKLPFAGVFGSCLTLTLAMPGMPCLRLADFLELLL